MKTPLLLDASVALAACLPDEPSHALARGFLGERVGSLLASDLLPVEILNGLVKAVRRGRLPGAAARSHWEDAWAVHPWLDVLPVRPHLGEALEIACRHHFHAYDLLHVLAAREAGRSLVTLDAKLHDQAKAARLGKWVVVLR